MIRFKDFDDLLNHMVASAPERIALLECNDEGVPVAISWNELSKRVQKRAEALEMGAGTCEAILADGTTDCIVEIFAAVRAGLQIALLDPLMPNGVMAPLLHSVDANCVWALNEQRQAELEGLLGREAQPAFGAHGVLFFTSGTTSLSKAVLLTDESLMSSAFNGSSLLPLSHEDTLLCMLPLSHVYGFVCGLLWGLSCGATVALGRGPRFYGSDLATFNPTVISVVPKLLEFLVARGALNDGLKLVLVGAADCADDLLNEVRKRGIRASLGYGLTETSSGIALSIGDDFHAMTVCPEDEVTIADDGEILVSAPTCVMQGYYRDADKTALALYGGVLHTGDKGIFDDRGLLHVQGRLKDVLTLPGGTKVFLPEYESALSAALKEQDVAVILYDGKLALICGALGRACSDNEIIQAIEGVMASVPPASRIGRVIQLGHALPRSAAGDIERWKIQEELQHGDC